MTFRLDQGFPKLTEPTVDPQTGRLNQTWLQLLITLWNRTGGPSGNVTPAIETGPDAGLVADLLNRVVQLETPAPETNQYLDLVKQIEAAALLAPPYIAVTTLQGRTVSGATPADTNVLAWSAAHEAWEPTASGSGTVNSGTANQLAYYPSSTNAVSGNADATISAGALTLGIANSVLGQLLLAGSTSGTVTLTPAVAAGTWTLTLPATGGTNGFFAQTNGSGAISWVGGLALITETVTSGSAANVPFSSIPAIYRDLEIRVRGRGTTAAALVGINLQFNGDTGANYDWEDTQSNNVTTASFNNNAVTLALIGNIAAASATANVADFLVAQVGDYRGTTFQKAGLSRGTIRTSTAAAGAFNESFSFWWRSTAAINAVKVFPSAGAFVDGSVVSLYGHM